MNKKMIFAAVLTAAVGLLGGCNSKYMTPGARADFSKIGLTEGEAKAMTDPKVREALDKKPMVVFPTALAVARVQASGYNGGWDERHRSYGAGNFSVVTVPDVEKDSDFEKIRQLPQVTGVAAMKQILLPPQLLGDVDLRAAAAKLHAGLLLYYTFDTQFHTDEKMPPLSTITLGAFPNHEAHVSTTASAVLMDVNNGYVYGVYESTSTKEQLANAWTSGEAMDQVRRKAEREAFAGLMEQFEKGWVNVVIEYKK